MHESLGMKLPWSLAYVNVLISAHLKYNHCLFLSRSCTLPLAIGLRIQEVLSGMALNVGGKFNVQIHDQVQAYPFA